MSQLRGATPSFYSFDALGSTDRLTDASSNVTDSYTYRAFGNIQATSGSTTNAFRYVGMRQYYFDANFLWYYARARYYDPITSRFFSPDPFGLGAADTNLYTYVANRPTGFSDPSGLDWRTDLETRSKACLCCCAQDAKILDVNFKRFVAGKSGLGYEHCFDFQVSVKDHEARAGERPGNCSIEWWEWTNQPYEHGMIAKKWNQMCTFARFRDHFEACGALDSRWLVPPGLPNRETLILQDCPSRSYRDPGVGPRILVILVKIKSAPTCTCPKAFVSFAAIQILDHIPVKGPVTQHEFRIISPVPLLLGFGYALP
jgi:RHS repeat-associated protein